MLRSALLSISLLSGVVLAGCASSADGGQNVRGRIGSGTTATKAWGLDVGSGTANVKVSARQLQVRNGSNQVGVGGGGVDAKSGTARVVTTAVGADGSFDLNVPRDGARWVFVVEGNDGNSALFDFGSGRSVLAVSADGSSAEVDLGDVKVTGGAAKPGKVLVNAGGVAWSSSDANEYFLTASGALESAQKAYAEAMQAAEDAQRKADEALKRADEARKRAEDAAKGIPTP